MKQLGHIFSSSSRSSAVILMLLGVVEQATRHSIGCEGFLGWWPREDERIPLGVSEGYTQLLKLLMQEQRHDVASLATCILHRMRFYEVSSRYEYAVVSVLEGLSAVGKVTSMTLDMLTSAKMQLRKLLKLINSRGPIEDPSPVAYANRSLILGEMDGPLSYKATNRLITLSDCCFSNWDVDSHLLLLLKERGFLPLSAALLSSSILRSEVGHAVDLFSDIASYIEAIILSLLFCRSGLLFLLHDPEISNTVVHALKGADTKKKETVPLCYAYVLISRGFFCRPSEIGMIVETHLRLVNVVDRLVASQPHSEELLWALWELCSLSRSDCGRQALLAIGHFPEAVSVLLAALDSVKASDTVPVNSGSSPVNLAIFHSAVEIFEVIVTDSTSSTLRSWIGHAKELHTALHSSSPGSNRKDAPTRLLEWIDGGVVFHRNGAIGLLRYAAVLASGRDAQMASTNILASDAMDVDNDVRDASNSSDGNIVEKLLGKPSNDTRSLRDSSIVQLTTAFRILAFISDNLVVAAALYDEGAIMVILEILICCTLMFERSSNNYDYLVDEGTECNSTSDLLLERNREQSLVDLLIPSLVLLINLLKLLQETKEQHRNTKLMKALLQLHRELSPKLAACASDLSQPYPEFALGLETVCHLLVSALAYWPACGWTPCLFHFLIDSLHATSTLAMGPKETCSFLFLLNDLLPEEGVFLWKSGIPVLVALRQLAVGTLLGPRKEREINWYMQVGPTEKLLGQLPPLLPRIAEIVFHCAISTLFVVQDLLRIFVVRMACQRGDDAMILLSTVIQWMDERLLEFSVLSDADAYKLYRLLDFLSSLLEHPNAKSLLLSVGAIRIFSKVLERCIGASSSYTEGFFEGRNASRNGFTQLSLCVPVSRSISLICDSKHDRAISKNFTVEDCSLLFFHLFRLCKALPVGRELVACLSAFKELGSSVEGRSALLYIFSHVKSACIEESESESGPENKKFDFMNALELKKRPPLLSCLIALLTYIESEDVPSVYAIEAVGALSSGALYFCMDGKRLNLNRVDAVKYLFGIPSDNNGTDYSSEGNLKYLQKLTTLLSSKIRDKDYFSDSDLRKTLHEVEKSATSLFLLLQKPTDSLNPDDMASGVIPWMPSKMNSSKLHMIANFSSDRVEHYSLASFGDKFTWECPEKLSQSILPAKRKISSLDGANRTRIGDPAVENTSQSAFSRGSVSFAPSLGTTRRDSFRTRKPNTSRPPSMHVDEYVNRGRNVDGSTNCNVIAIQRLGSTGSGRPPSIHVDEFMKRERGRQNPVGAEVSSQSKSSLPENDSDMENISKPKQMRPDLDDDLQGVNIDFGGEESESDDVLLFPQPDDNLQQPAPVVEQNSPRSIVEETESDNNESNKFPRLGTPVSSHVDENINQSDFSSRMSVSRPEMMLTREPSISSDRKYPDQSEAIKDGLGRTSNTLDSINKVSGQVPASNFYPKRNQNVNVPLLGNSQEFHDKRLHLAQPPLPPMPPPTSVSPLQSKMHDSVSSQQSPFVNSMQDVQPSFSNSFNASTEYLSFNTSSSPSSSIPDTKFSRTTHSSPGRAARPPPPLPPTPPPYSMTSSTYPALRTSTSQSFVSAELLQNIAPSNDSRIPNLSAFSPSLMSPMLFNRPPSIPFSPYGANPTSQQAENPSSISQSFPISLPSIQSLQLQPLQPPQLPRASQPPQHLRSPITASPQADQGTSTIRSPVQMQVQQLQLLQPPQASPAHVYYQSLPQDSFSRAIQQQRVDVQQQSPAHLQGQLTSQQQDDGGMSLQHFFSSPEAIQSLLSDRDKLCQLLEQHPKLMQMLQDRLGQL